MFFFPQKKTWNQTVWTLLRNNSDFFHWRTLSCCELAQSIAYNKSSKNGVLLVKKIIGFYFSTKSREFPVSKVLWGKTSTGPRIFHCISALLILFHLTLFLERNLYIVKLTPVKRSSIYPTPSIAAASHLTPRAFATPSASCSPASRYCFLRTHQHLVHYIRAHSRKTSHEARS